MEKRSKTKAEIEKLEGYDEILQDIRSLLQRATYQAYKAVDNLRVQAYWQVGERMDRAVLEHKERADYGERAIERLSFDLGFQRRLLYRMLQFFRTYPIVSTLSTQLSWSHYQELMLISEPDERQFYEIQAIQNTWSVRELRAQIKSGLYQRSLEEGGLTITRRLPLKPILPEQVFKDTYTFDFLELQSGYSERALEEALLSNVEKLLLEFGTDFSLAGRQRKIIIDGEIHSIDLEFYHRGLPCIVLVDLKIGRFKSEYVGQMNKYLNYYRENRKYQWEKDPVGLMICEDKGREEVHYALGGLENKIFVAEYRTKLPGEEEIVTRLKALKKGKT